MKPVNTITLDKFARRLGIKSASTKKPARKPLPSWSRQHMSDVAADLAHRDMTRDPLPKGQFVASFFLPLDLCPPRDKIRHASGWQLAALNAACFAWMEPQLAERNARRDFTLPLTGRPWLYCLRMSTTEPDSDSGWEKTARDRLLVTTARAKRHRLGLLVDDRPELLETVVRWEHAPRGHGGCLLCLYTGTQPGEIT